MTDEPPEKSDPWNYYAALLMVIARRFAASRAWLRAKVAPSDIVQETMAIAYAKRNDWAELEKGHRTGWLVRTLNHVAKDKVRDFTRQKRDIRLEKSFCQFVDSISGWFERSLESPGLRPDQQASNQEMVRKLLELLPKLTDAQREVFEAREFDDLSYDQIAERLELTGGQVAGLLRDARRKLREWLGEDDHE